jgi:hypothetical protein
MNGALRRFADSTFLQSRQNDIINSYKDMALGIYRNQNNSGKTFILSNWETENALYCGSAYQFDKDTSFRGNCLNQYQALYNVATPQLAFQGLKLWFHYRQLGVDQAKQIAATEGIKNVIVKTGIEFVSVNLVHEVGYPTVLFDLLPTTNDIDTLGYSSYESINQGTLNLDLPTIEKNAGARNIGITEYGFYEGENLTINQKQYSSDNLMRLTTQQILAFINQGRLTFGIIWQAFYDGSSQDFSLMDSNGNNSSLMTSLITALNISH